MNYLSLSTSWKTKHVYELRSIHLIDKKKVSQCLVKQGTNIFQRSDANQTRENHIHDVRVCRLMMKLYRNSLSTFKQMIRKERIVVQQFHLQSIHVTHRHNDFMYCKNSRRDTHGQQALGTSLELWTSLKENQSDCDSINERNNKTERCVWSRAHNQLHSRSLWEIIGANSEQVAANSEHKNWIERLAMLRYIQAKAQRNIVPIFVEK